MRSKKLAFAIIGSVLLFLISIAALYVIIIDDRNSWPGTIGVIATSGLVCLGIGYVLGQTALDRTLAQVNKAITTIEHKDPQ